MGLMSRNKGKAGEREVVALLNALLGDLAKFARNHNQADGWRSSEERKDVETNLPLSIEVKRTEAKTWKKFLEQARRQAKDQELPVLFHRANGEPWKVVLDLNTVEFAHLIRAWLYFKSHGSPGVRGQEDVTKYLESKKHAAK